MKSPPSLPFSSTYNPPMAGIEEGRVMGKHDVSISSDYALTTAGQLGFYVGYEATICPEHGKDAGCDCDKEEWAFTVDDGGCEVERIPLSEIGDAGDNMAELLLRGISMFGTKRWKD